MTARATLRALVVVTLLGVSALPAPAFAQASAADTARAAQLKTRGDEAMDGFRYADALAAYAQAYELTKSPALLYNQARAHQALGDFAQAYDFYERFDREAPPELKAKVPRLAQLMEEVRARVARLTIRCNVAGAQVVLGDRVLGATPIGRELRITSGRATMKVTADGYEPFKREVDLPGGGQAAVDVELVSKSTAAVLVVKTDVAGARVTVDGRAAGQAPIELAVNAGPHTLDVDRAGYDSFHTSVVLKVGERKEMTVPLTAPPPIYAKWWFWTGVGVVVVGGVVTVIALTTERGPDSGTVTPGRLSAPLVRW